ncbi:MAG: DNA polymerase III subunit delta [Fibrobacter sp.]|nr:DNA polymerase III subunit delta [Fibrobacter sp.]
MAAKTGSVSYETLMGKIEAREFSPIYILMGEESYYIDKLCDALMNSILPEDEREFNQFVMFGSDVTADQVADYARELPMMSQYKVIVVKEAQNIKQLEALERYLDHYSPQTILVYCHKNGSIDRRKKFVTRAQAVGVVFESAKIKESALPAFVESYLKTRHVAIEPKTALVIAESIGQDLSRLASELDKLCLAMTGDKRKVTAELVEECIGVSKDYNSYELRNAIVNKDVLKANRIVNYFDKNPKSGGIYIILPSLFSYFQTLMVAWYAPNRNDTRALAEHLELRSEWGVKDYVNGMRNYSAMKTMQIISKLREIDEKSKGLDSPNTSTGDLLRELIYFILH